VLAGRPDRALAYGVPATRMRGLHPNRAWAEGASTDPSRPGAGMF
jgi:hypothetical protein